MLVPKLFTTLKDYSKEQFAKDVIAGIIVAIIALPLSIALALASGVRPEQGIYTAIIAGFLISFLGGSRVQIAGPTAAFAAIVGNIVARNGMDGLILATIMAGLILILMGIFKMGVLIKFIPYTITTGFTAGIAVTIAIGQVKDLFGLSFKNAPIETVEKLREAVMCASTWNPQALAVGITGILILVIWPKINGKIPGSLLAVLAGIAMVKGFNLNVNTIGSLYKISNSLPVFRVPHFTFSMVQTLLPDAMTIAILAAIESLLSCVVADGMIGGKHRSNMELIAQGVGNMASGLFGVIPATGAIARTAANIKNGGRTPVAGMVHALVLVLVLVILMPYAALIPMPTIAAILIMVAYNMSGWREFVNVVKTSPKSDTIILIATFVLTVIFDLVVAIEVGMMLACLLFIKRMSEVTEISSWKYVDDEEEADDPESIQLRKVPKDTLVYEINGPMFFGAADKFLEVITRSMNGPKRGQIRKIIIRMRSIPALDTTSMNHLSNVLMECKKRNITLILSHVQKQPYQVMKKKGLLELIGRENLCENIDKALERAESL
ncbi:MAG: SulP family inorganic anion transporter [Anaerostipes faecalis]|nr:SulP family inorganic anion transporter [Anaerostipes faecalis]